MALRPRLDNPATASHKGAMNSELRTLLRAADYAARQHVAQRRKGDAAEPYINHLLEVASLLAEATGDNDIVLLVGGLLHDTLEDTDTTFEDLVERFGEEVASLVAEVTDDKSLKKEERKRLQVETAANKSRRARLLKIADKTSNLRGLVRSPPTGWNTERMRDYVVWAGQVVRSCRGLDIELEAAFDAAHAEASRRFGT